MVCAAAFMVKKTVLDKIGAFDDEFHMYGEDFELAKRITNNGWHLYFVPDAQVHHLYGQSSAQRWTNIEKQITMAKAHIAFQRKSLPAWLVPLNIASMCFVYLVYSVLNIRRRDEFVGYGRLAWVQMKNLLGSADQKNS